MVAVMHTLAHEGAVHPGDGWCGETVAARAGARQRLLMRNPRRMRSVHPLRRRARSGADPDQRSGLRLVTGAFASGQHGPAPVAPTLLMGVLRSLQAARAAAA